MADKIERNGMELNKLIDEYIEYDKPSIVTNHVNSKNNLWNRINYLTDGLIVEAIEKRRRNW